MKSYVAENLVKARKHYGWTQQQAAHKIGIKRARYAAYEEGRANPPPEILTKICAVFDITNIASFISDEKFDMGFRSTSRSMDMPKSLLETQYEKLTGKDKIAVNALLEI